MAASSDSRPFSVPGETVTQRTQACLLEMQALYRDTGSQADLYLIIGKTGVGKSSILEDLTDSTGHSQQSLNCVTHEYEIEKARIGNKVAYIMDTPGFDPQNEVKAFREIVRGVQAVSPFARFVGLLFVTCINQPRFDDFDRKLLRFIRTLCGDDYLPRITFVTTFWTAAAPRQQEIFKQQQESLRHHWQEEFNGKEPNLYEHGLEYEPGGQIGDHFIDWFENRDSIAQHGKHMLAHRYAELDTLGTCVAFPKIALEVTANTPLHEMDAAKLLGLLPMASHVQNEDPPPLCANENSDPRIEDDRHENSTSLWTNFTRTGLPVVSWLAENVEFQTSITHGANEFPFPQGHGYNGNLDPNSCVDILKLLGRPSSQEARREYARIHNIAGVPLSATWNNNIREHALRSRGN